MSGATGSPAAAGGTQTKRRGGRLWSRILAWALAVVAVVVASGFTYFKLIEKGYIRYNKWDRRIRGTLRVGDPAPDLELRRYDGSSLRLSSLWGRKPVVLVFGSCT